MHKSKRKDTLKITIGGLAGVGKGTVGKMLAESLGCPISSAGDMFRKFASENNMTLNQLEERAMHDPKIDSEVDLKTQKYGRENGNFVFEGRLAWYFIPDSIRVLLKCEFEVRTERVARRDGISKEDARQQTRHREGTIFARYLSQYNLSDISDENHYDLVIDTEQLSAIEVHDLILEHIANQ